MAKAIGARVVTTAGSDEKVRICRELGADLAVNYKTDDVDARIKEFAPQGINVWWETLREPNFDRTVRPAGRAGADDHHGRPRRSAAVSGRARSTSKAARCSASPCSTPRPTSSARGRRHQPLAWPKASSRPNIDRVLPLSEAAAAHRLQEENTIGKEGTLAGKIVLVP